MTEPNETANDDLEAFDRECSEYVRKTLGWEFDLLQIIQQFEEATRDA